MAADPQSLKRWLKETRGIAEPLLRFDLSAVSAHLMPQMAVTLDGAGGGQGAEGAEGAGGGQGASIAQARTLPELRRDSAAAARAELDRRARDLYGLIGAWRRFETDSLPAKVPLAIGEGVVWVYPTLARTRQGLQVRYEWSEAEARREWGEGAAQLARTVLASQARDLGKSISANAALLLAASPHLASSALTDLLLQWTFRRACFADAEAPRTGTPLTKPSIEDEPGCIRAWMKSSPMPRTGSPRHGRCAARSRIRAPRFWPKRPGEQRPFAPIAECLDSRGDLLGLASPIAALPQGRGAALAAHRRPRRRAADAGGGTSPLDRSPSVPRETAARRIALDSATR